MIPEIVLHVGMHKTGSTSIQNALKGYDDGRVLYAPFDNANHSEAIQFMFRPWRPKMQYRLTEQQFERARRAAFEQIDAALKLDRERLVISAEGTLALLPDQYRALCRFLDDRSTRLRLIAYIRDPISYASSWYQQLLKKGDGAFRVPPLRYKNRIGRVMKVFGEDRLELVHFDPGSFPQNSAVQDFATRVGIDPKRLKEEPTNEGLSTFAAAALYLWNVKDPHRIDSPEKVRARNALVALLQDRSRETDKAALAGPADGSDVNRRGARKFRFCETLIRDTLDFEDIRWMEARLGKELVAPARPQSDETNGGITSQADFATIGDAAFDWLMPLLAKRKLRPASPDAAAAMNALYAHLLKKKSPRSLWAGQGRAG